ncbi:permease for cytosine/purines, uracil, thiamine, allantoin-domain-containing protein [Suillus paluster]|uniref:permease for cytosine/purines, uracil, thiamine, allantoin-domain-containing protein n=1 Tax=Suillus paluster TaxID=48578 RepID=UPI001B869397|nr:permease for cytosine/purines, uracil, thiamine, allantoin-domain-containing protein [Suillus paluster]KAG1742654.1 permease for cytosine/purines, uracil, thiamine, allantoin-domain-containing protein [Suillus paluster]
MSAIKPGGVQKFMEQFINAVLTTIPIGVLAQSAFTLRFGNTVATILRFRALGSVATAFIATLGPITGLRTMIIAHFSSGYFGGTIYSILNIFIQLSFSTTAVILGGQTLANINPGTLSLIVGIIIIGVCCLIPCFIGYDMVHVYERYAWIVTSVIMLFLWGLGGKAGYDINTQKLFEDTGRALSADILSFGGIVFGSFSGWAPVAADYNCRLPADTPPMRVFLLTFLSVFIPLCFVEILGAALMTITDPAYIAAYADGSTGGVIAQVLSPWGHFGQFILVLLALSIIVNNIPNTYSTGLSIQALGRPFAMVPRFFCVFLASVIYTVAGVAGREHFSAILSNFLSILSYWTAFFIVIVAEEHFIFRQKNGPLGGYNLDDYDTLSKLPLGLAGAVVGMSEVWYTGPLEKMAGATYGADLGFENETIQNYVKKGKARLVQGDALVKSDVRQAWSEAQGSDSEPTQVDFLIFTVSGTPHFSLAKCFTINPPNLVTQSLLNVLETLPSPQPKIITISSAGLMRASHKSVPLPLKPLYNYLLTLPHRDKCGAEEVVAYSTG